MGIDLLLSERVRERETQRKNDEDRGREGAFTERVVARSNPNSQKGRWVWVGGVWVELGPRVTCGDCGVFPGMMTVETSRTRRLIVEQHLLVGVLNHKPQSRRLQAWREVLEFKDASSARVRPEP